MPLPTETRSGQDEILVSMGVRRVGGVYSSEDTELAREVAIELLAATLPGS